MKYRAVCGAESPERKAQLPHMRWETASMGPVRFGCGGVHVSWSQSLGKRSDPSARRHLSLVNGLKSVIDVGIRRRVERLRELDDIAAREKYPDRNRTPLDLLLISRKDRVAKRRRRLIRGFSRSSGPATRNQTTTRSSR